MYTNLLRTACAGFVVALCATSVALTASGPREPWAAEEGRCASGPSEAGHSSEGSESARRALAVHNQERTQLGLPPLAWDCSLEHEAALWARALAQRGKLEHASAAERGGAGENLWMGSAGGFPVEQMVGRFIEEKRHYRHARFPEISNTGNWADAGHYSQVVWRDSRALGCALAQGTGRDVLVCRYFPAGNVQGRIAY
jgi:hypothetical protein